MLGSALVFVYNADECPVSCDCSCSNGVLYSPQCNACCQYDLVRSVVQAQSAAAHEAQADADPSDKDHMWDFIKDGLNMLIRSATLQVWHYVRSLRKLAWPGTTDTRTSQYWAAPAFTQ